MRTALIWMTAILGAATLAAGAAGGPPYQETFQEEGSFVDGDLCGAGLEVSIDFAIEGRLQFVRKGPSGLAYFLESGKLTQRITNTANGKYVTTTSNVTEKDQRITDNGDGTLTILVLATGNETYYGMNGKAIGRNPGQTRYEVLVDEGGTPNDPFDDEVIDFLGVVKGSTGRSDDFCAVVVPALG